MQDSVSTLSVTEAGRALECSRRLSFRLAREGAIPVARLGKRKLRVPVVALAKMLSGVIQRGGNSE